VLSFATRQKLDPAATERCRRDRELVRAILSGDPDRFARLHALYATPLFRFAVKRLGDGTEAEDVAQDVFLEVHHCLASWAGRSAQQKIFDLYYGENRPTRLIAAELGKSNQAVKISLFRTRRAMLTRLEEQGLHRTA